MSFWKPGEQQAPSLAGSSSSSNKNIEQPTNEVTMTISSSETTANNGSRLSLSKGVLTMKFMKRKADAEQAASEEAEKRRKLLDDHWSSDYHDAPQEQTISSSNVSINAASSSSSSSGGPRYDREEGDLMSALPGRRSFGGYNPAMERYYSQVMDEKRFNVVSDKTHQHSVSDSEMLERYQNLIGLPRGPNQGMKPGKQSSAGRGGGGNNGGGGGKGGGGGGKQHNQQQSRGDNNNNNNNNNKNKNNKRNRG